jgi:predicted acylesterase/phospholipase RssA
MTGHANEVVKPPESLKPCDIVMKGGITSGVVYPSAVWEISRLYSFKNVGGTSAGAIAAVMTAAAQRRRLRGDDSGFQQVQGIPDELAADGLLFRLFRPNASTKALFATITGLFARKAAIAKLAGIYSAYPLWSILGIAPAVLLLFFTPRTWADYVLAILLLALCATVFALGALASDLVKKLSENYNGLVTGIANDASDPSKAIALTSWLEQRIREIAGIDDERTPLTFGMLWHVASEGAMLLTEPPEERDVNLEMVTTNLTFGRPFKFPFDSSQFFFKQSEMRDFFPAHVVDWMIKNQRLPKDDRERRRFHVYAVQQIYPFPPISDLPVIVATRMSLAFPVLLCGVPTYAADFNETSNQFEGATPALERCWFTDGGLSSNFPLTMFDSPIPLWPTFGINLRPFTNSYPQDMSDESKNVYLPNNNQGGRLVGFNRPVGFFGFMRAILDTMQTWNDATQAIMPGFRDRIVTVRLSDDEGGLNLDMPPEILKRLKARGAAAGKLIAERFANLPVGLTTTMPMGWANHRWLRYRTTMGALRKYLRALLRGVNGSDPSIEQVIREARSNAGYPLGDPEAAIELTDATAQLAARYDAAEYLDDHLPKPPPELASRASLDMKA